MVKKLVLLKPFNNKKFYKDFFSKKRRISPFYNFDKKVKKYGIDLKVINDKIVYGNKDNYIVCFDVPYPWQVRLWIRLILNSNRNILYCFESPLVNPFNHFKILKFFFKKIYTYNDELVDNKSFQKFFIPQNELIEKITPLPFNKKKLLVMINAKKSPFFLFKLLSCYKSDYYKERVKAIEYFENVKSKDFDLYGYGWDKPDKFSLNERIFGFNKYTVYKGSVEDKFKKMEEYKFCLSFENTSAPGYITEKMFDCFKAGCVPIYLGASNVLQYIPKKSFIDFRDFKSWSDLSDFLQKMNEYTYRKYIIAGRKFLKSSVTQQKWFGKDFLRNFLNSLS